MREKSPLDPAEIGDAVHRIAESRDRAGQLSAVVNFVGTMTGYNPTTQAKPTISALVGTPTTSASGRQPLRVVIAARPSRLMLVPAGSGCPSSSRKNTVAMRRR